MRVLTRMRPRDAHVVDNGRVGCPVRGLDVDMEACLGCPWLDGLDGDEAVTYVMCRTGSPLGEALPNAPWLY